MSQINQKSRKTNILYIISPILLILIIWAINKLAFYGNGRKATESEAIATIRNVIRYQTEFYLKNRNFSADALEKIGLSPNSKYDFDVDIFEDKIIIFGKLKPKNSLNLKEQIKKLIYPDIVGNAKSFVAGIFLL
ncbi:hypothetical protein, partial [Gloeomargarita lithophora]|uniref:hypothetical protein n=1 Tax=Gloeomargarita lithophora TaxID=1188228 RepID=UPI003F71FDCD